MRAILFSVASSVLCLGFFSACDTAGLDDFVPEVVVSGVLIADQPLPEIQLALSGPIGEPYDFEERSINDAVVQIEWVREDESVTVIPFEPAARGGGRYLPVDSLASTIVEGGGTYRLEAIVPGFAEPVTAETVVPTAFSVVNALPDTVAYQVGPSPQMDITPSSSPGRQNVYIFNVRARDIENFSLTPFAADLVNERGVDPVDLREASSPLLNEGNYMVNPDGSIRLSIVWLAFNFYGPQRILVTAVDDAIIAFAESQAIQFLPTTLSPGEIPNVVSNVQNGLGVFGSVAQVSALTFLEQAP